MAQRSRPRLIFTVLFVGFSNFNHGQELSARKESDLYFTSFDGTVIHYEVSGDGFPVLLVHGFISDGATWKKAPLYLDLLQAGYKVIIPDMRGKWKV